MNKNTIETIQTNTILRAFQQGSFMERSIEFARCVIKKLRNGLIACHFGEE